MRTFTPKAGDVVRQWHVIDASDVVLGRLASQVAILLRGKHKPTFAPHLDSGDHVIVVNADKVVLTADKAARKPVWSHSGYPGGIRQVSYAEALARRPEEAVRRTIRGMLPKGRLGRSMARKLKIYAGPSHPHAAQQPEVLSIAHARARVS